MDNVIEFNDFAVSSNNMNGETACWLCQKSTLLRALFCQHCGTIQPARPMDHFARLGLESRIDIDSDQLERQYAVLKRTLDPMRFAIRGMGERNHAAKQMEALEVAYRTLRDPLRRGRYWLVLHEKEIKETKADNPMIADLQGELEKATLAAQCDKIAQKAGNALEQGVMGLMQSLRTQNWQLANAILAEVEGLEAVLSDARARRATIAPHMGLSDDELTSVK